MNESQEAARWQQVKALLADALERPVHERRAFIEAAANGDAALRAELNALVQAAEATSSLLDEPPPAALTLQALESRSEQSWTGRRVGAYRLLSLLGGGGMGQVYLAERADGLYEQRVAVKLMREGFDRAGLELRFRAERQILASLDHPNLAKLIDGGITDDGVPYFVMELVDGEPIDAYCNERELRLAARLQLFRTVCQVVHYAHRQGVVHRDLKPANILVTHDGVVKLVDFGIAKQITAPSSNTATAQRVMTLEYASPEQVRGEPVTPASDIFSLGVVLYRLLTGASPYPASTTTSDYELGKAICDTEPAPPSQGVRTRPLKRSLKGDLDSVVMMALRKDPSRRYASADAMADDVFRHLEGLPVQARRGAWSYRAGRFVLRHKAVVGAALVANLALVAGLSFAAYEAYEAHQQKVRAERHFASVRKLANVFIFEVDKAIERLPGSLNARKMLVDTALAYLQQLSAEAHDDPTLPLELAAGFRSIGDIQGAGSQSSFGDTKAAMSSYEHAAALLRPLMQGGASQRAAQAEWVKLSTRKGSLLMTQGRSREAEAIELEGLALAQSLAASGSASYDEQKLLAVQYRFLCSFYQRMANGPSFEKMFRLAVDQLMRLRALKPDDLDNVADLGTVHGLRAVHLRQNIGTPAAMQEALGEYQQSLAVMRPEYEKHPDHLVLAGNYGKVNGYTGLLLSEIDRAEESLPYHHRSVEVSDALVQKDPGDVRARIEQAEAHGRLGMALADLGRTDEAIRAQQQSLEAFERLPDSTRNEVVVQFNLATAHRELGETLRKRAGPGDEERACVQFRTSQTLFDDNLKRRAESALTRNAVSALRKALAQCH